MPTPNPGHLQTQGRGNPAVAHGAEQQWDSPAGVQVPIPACTGVPAPPGWYLSSLHPRKPLKHGHTRAQRWLVAGRTHFCSLQLAETFPDDKPCARREEWPRLPRPSAWGP